MAGDCALARAMAEDATMVDSLLRCPGRPRRLPATCSKVTWVCVHTSAVQPLRAMSCPPFPPT